MTVVREDISQGLVIQLKAGSRDAFNDIFHAYSQRLYFFALRYLKSESDAEEIVQETFLKLWERHENIDLSLSIHAYLFKISFNFIQKKLQKHFKEEEFKHRLTGETIQFDNHTSNLLNYHFLLQHITDLIDQLPPRQKEILRLRKLDGFSLKEISNMLSLSQKTVEAHLTAGLKFLKERLSSEKFDDLLLFALIFSKKSLPD